jgi:hypothetical protein
MKKCLDMRDPGSKKKLPRFATLPKCFIQKGSTLLAEAKWSRYLLQYTNLFLNFLLGKNLDLNISYPEPELVQKFWPWLKQNVALQAQALQHWSECHKVSEIIPLNHRLGPN